MGDYNFLGPRNPLKALNHPRLPFVWNILSFSSTSIALTTPLYHQRL